MRLVDPPGGLPWALLALCGSSLVLNLVLFGKLALSDDSGDCAEVVAFEPQPTQDPVAVPGEIPAPVQVAVELEPEVVLPSGTHVVSGSVESNLAYTFRQITPPDHADVVSAVYARLFFWDLDVRRDLQRGDTVRVVYEWDGELAHIPVASYHSKKLGQTLAAYRFQASTDDYASYWDDEGTEVPYRLKESPLTDYEQVTSLLKDRPRHRGMDFKTPVGTPVSAPRSGTVSRVNWNVANNGSCVEIRYRDGTLAKFLHLSEVDVKAGQRVAAGEQIGASGNSGRSTAPHLHYELEKGGRVVDPVDYHGVYRRALGPEDQERWQIERERLEAMLATARG